MARSGTGVQGDPYVVHNWDELVQSIGESGAYVEFPLDAVRTTDTVVQRGKLYYKLVGANYVEVTNPKQSELSTYYENSFEIDLNDEYPEGVLDVVYSGTHEALSVQGYLDGKGGTIRNLYSQGTVSGHALFYFGGDGSISNTDILNIYFVGRDTGCAIFNNTGTATGNSLMRRCRMSGVLYNADFYRKDGTWDIKIERCTFAMYGSIHQHTLFDSDGRSMADFAFKNTVFDFTCPHIYAISRAVESGSGLTISASNCLFIGSYGFEYSWDTFNYMDACVFDFTSSETRTLQFNNINVPCLVNTTKVPNYSYTDGLQIPANLIRATTQQQMQDASWLLSQGFPVGRLT